MHKFKNITPATGTFISLAVARAMATTWARSQESISVSNPKAVGFGKDKVQEILDQVGCVGIRIYNGIESGNKTFIVIGTDINGDDLIYGLILDIGSPCPNTCAPNNALNACL